MPRSLNTIASAACLAVLGSPSFAEPWEVIVPAARRGEIDQIAVLPSGDLIVSGSAAESSQHQADGWIARYTSSGEEVWSHRISEVGSRTEIRMEVTRDRIYLAGAHFAPNFGDDSKGFVFALSLDGSMDWAAGLSETGAALFPSQVLVLKSGDLLVTGSTYAREQKNSWQVYSARLTSEGKLLWSYRSEPVGQYYTDLAPRRSAIVIGQGEGPEAEFAGPAIERPSGDLDLFIRRHYVAAGPSPIGRCEVLSSDGQLQVQAACLDVEETRIADGGKVPFRFTAYSPGFVAPTPLEISKTGPQGEILWTWNYPGSDKAGLTDVLPLEDGGLIGAGYLIRKEGARMHRYDALLFRLDSSGKQVWSHVFDSPRRDIFAKLAALGPTEFYAVGHTGAGHATDWNAWIIRMGIDGVRPASGG